MNLSFWEYEVFFKNIDVAIIGSGIVGLNAALQIKTLKPNWKVVVLERGAFPSGASTRNAGVTCFGSISELLDDFDSMEEAEVWKLVEMRWQGLERLKEKVGLKNLGYVPCDGYEVFGKEDQDVFENCAEHIAVFNKKISSIIGHNKVYGLANDTINSFGFKGIDKGIVIRKEGQVHTGKMMASLLRLAQRDDIEIINGIEIQEIQDNNAKVTLQTSNGWEINAKQVLVATNGFTPKLFPNITLQPARNQVWITAPIPNLKFSGNFHHNKGYNYFRTINNRVLIGGGRDLSKAAETTSDFGFTEIIQDHLHHLLYEMILPNQPITIEHRWSGILGVGNEKRPIIQQVSDNVSVAVRLGGMGVAIGTLVGEEGGKMVAKS